MILQKRTSRRGQVPREPLYTVEDLATRMQLPASSLRSLMSHYPGLDVAMVTPRNLSTNPRRMYRASDAKRWWQALPETARLRARQRATT